MVDVNDANASVPPVIEQIAQVLCSETRSPNIRAIALFHLKAEAISTGGLPSMGKRAKIFAAVAMLQHLEGDDPELLTVEQRSLIPDYNEILGIAIRYGWTSIRNLESKKTFLKNFATSAEDSMLLAEMVDFAFSYSTFRNAGVKAGFSNARDFLVKKKAGTPGYARATITNRWSKFRSGASAGLIFLMHHEKYRLLSPTSDDEFVESLLSQVNDISWEQFFVDYIRLTKLMRPHGYHDVKIEIPQLKGRAMSVAAKPFSAKEQKILEKLRLVPKT